MFSSPYNSELSLMVHERSIFRSADCQEGSFLMNTLVWTVREGSDVGRVCNEAKWMG